MGHIFRKRSPYQWPGNVNVVKKNTVRLAEVWLDEYKVRQHSKNKILSFSIFVIIELLLRKNWK